MTFWRFLQQRARVSGALGDFARDAVADPEFPRQRTDLPNPTYRNIVTHLEWHGADPDTFAAFRRDWADWEAMKHPRGRTSDSDLFEPRRGPNVVVFDRERLRRCQREGGPERGPA